MLGIDTHIRPYNPVYIPGGCWRHFGFQPFRLVYLIFAKLTPISVPMGCCGDDVRSGSAFPGVRQWLRLGTDSGIVFKVKSGKERKVMKGFPRLGVAVSPSTTPCIRWHTHVTTHVPIIGLATVPTGSILIFSHFRSSNKCIQPASQPARSRSLEAHR